MERVERRPQGLDLTRKWMAAVRSRPSVLQTSAGRDEMAACDAHGKLLDAVDLLVKQQSDWREHSAFSEVDALKRRIDRVKQDQAVHRTEQLRSDLALLRASSDAADKARHADMLAALRALLDDLPPQD